MRARSTLAGLVLLTAPLTAGETCTQAAIPLQTPNWNQTITAPRFDPLSGTLTAVRIELDGFIDGLALIESPDAVPTTWTLSFEARFELRRPDTSFLVAAQPAQARRKPCSRKPRPSRPVERTPPAFRTARQGAGEPFPQ